MYYYKTTVFLNVTDDIENGPIVEAEDATNATPKLLKGTTGISAITRSPTEVERQRTMASIDLDFKTEKSKLQHKQV